MGCDFSCPGMRWPRKMSCVSSHLLLPDSASAVPLSGLLFSSRFCITFWSIKAPGRQEPFDPDRRPHTSLSRFDLQALLYSWCRRLRGCALLVLGVACNSSLSFDCTKASYSVSPPADSHCKYASGSRFIPCVSFASRQDACPPQSQLTDGVLNGRLRLSVAAPSWCRIVSAVTRGTKSSMSFVPPNRVLCEV